MPAMDALVSYFDAERGRRTALASALELSPGTVSQWRQVPAHHCLKIEEVTGISRHRLRPDVYGPLPSSASHPAAETPSCPTEVRPRPAENHPETNL